MIKRRKLKQKADTNELIKIILYMVLMTTFFMLYYCDENNDEIEKSLIENYQSYNNKTTISPPGNGN